ncbi:MAG: RICIN domain-containing protein [Bacteroidota bacterium]
MKTLLSSIVLILLANFLLAGISLPSHSEAAFSSAAQEVSIDLKGNFFIESVMFPGQVLDVVESNTKPGTNVILYQKHGSTNQRFKFVPAGGGYYYIESLLAERMVLDIQDYGTANGTNIQIVRRGVGTPAQKFKVSTQNGHYYFSSAMGSQYKIGVSRKDKNIVSKTSYSNISEILFKLVKIGGSSTQPQKPTAKPMSFSIVNYNTLLLDKMAASNYLQEYRASLIPSAIRDRGNWDVVVFNEAFSNDARSKLKRGMSAQGYRYQTKVVDKSGNLTNGGVFISSRHRILATDMIVYSAGLNIDKLSNKGAIYAKIQKEGRIIHVFGTHLQADRGQAEASTRYRQMRELRQFIDQKTRGAGARNEPVVIAGDFNFCYVQDRNEYNLALSTLNAKTTARIPANTWTFDPIRNSWAKYRYEDDEDPQWLDYVFVGRNGRQPNSTEFQVVKFKTRSSYKMTRENDPLGITGKVIHSDLSDHYGLSARFRF